MTAKRCRTGVAILFLGGTIAAPILAQDADRSIVTPPPAAITPLTQADRNKLYVQALFNPISFVQSGASAGWGQLRDRPAEWREGGAGFGKRYASSFAQHITQETLKFGLASVLHEDNRYVPSGKTSIPSRVVYAMVSTFRSLDDAGQRQVSYSNIGSMAGASFLSRFWQPASTGGPANGAVSFGVSIAVAAGMNVAREFLHR